jgi:predicted metal-dependent phosphoesterase TrpH
VADRTEAFDSFLHNGSPYYVKHYAPHPVDTVRLVRAAGGVAVFAHPGAHKRGRVVGDDVIVAMAEAGLAGLEIDHPDHDPATRDRLRGLARELGLLVTGASDFHGAASPTGSAGDDRPGGVRRARGAGDGARPAHGMTPA